MGNKHSDNKDDSTPDPPPVRWSVASNNWITITGNAVNNKTNASLLITGTTDPARGCTKAYTASYTCMPGGNTKTINIAGEAGGHTATFNCDNERATCMGGKLTITDDGNLTFTNEKGETIWQSNTHVTGLQTLEFSATKSKYGRNYLKTGEYLRPGEIIGSPSGNCYITVIIKDDNTISMIIGYRTLACNNPEKPVKALGEYGYVTSNSNTQPIYSMKNGPQSSEFKGQLAYSDNNNTKRVYPEHMQKKGADFFSLGNFTQEGNNIKTIDNSNLDQCKSACNSLEECHGFIYHNDDKTCNIKDSGMYPNNLNRVHNEASEMYIRQIDLTNSASCSKQIIPTTSNIFVNRVSGNNMTASTLCQLGEATAEQSSIVAMREKDLESTLTDVNRNINTLNVQSATLDSGLSESVNQLQKDSAKFKHNITNIKKTTKQLVSVNAMDDSATLDMISTNMQFMIWTSFAAVAVIGCIKATR